MKVDIEEFFAAEVALRIAARDYSSAEHSMSAIEVRRRSGRALRVAARAYANMADLFERAVEAMPDPELSEPEASANGATE